MGTKRKIVVILGPTASGKSDLAVRLGKAFNGEVISADSRQVYRGMDIGSGKITKKEMEKVPHHLLDVASPKRRFSVSRYKALTIEKIENILSKNKLPIICGGTAFYIKAITENITLPDASPDWDLRRRLEKKGTECLHKTLKKKDPQRAKNIDTNNRRRLIRALEIVLKTKKPVPKIKSKPIYNFLLLGIKKDQEELNRRIEVRLQERLENGMIEEVKELRRSGLSWKRLESFGLEYRWVARYLQEKISYSEMEKQLFTDIKKFSKKQMVWWKHDRSIFWIKSFQEAEKLTNKFLE